MPSHAMPRYARNAMLCAICHAVPCYVNRFDTGELTVLRRRHYSDAVLVAVIALCTLENDVIHAGYLALALYFFRSRESLRTPALFRWLPLYNFGVMLLSLAYQAPLQQLWHGESHRQVRGLGLGTLNPQQTRKFTTGLSACRRPHAGRGALLV